MDGLCIAWYSLVILGVVFIVLWVLGLALVIISERKKRQKIIDSCGNCHIRRELKEMKEMNK